MKNNYRGEPQGNQKAAEKDRFWCYTTVLTEASIKMGVEHFCLKSSLFARIK